MLCWSRTSSPAVRCTCLMTSIPKTLEQKQPQDAYMGKVSCHVQSACCMGVVWAWDLGDRQCDPVQETHAVLEQDVLDAHCCCTLCS